MPTTIEGSVNFLTGKVTIVLPGPSTVDLLKAIQTLSRAITQPISVPMGRDDVSDEVICPSCHQRLLP
jgi:hypothetical protein